MNDAELLDENQALNEENIRLRGRLAEVAGERDALRRDDSRERRAREAAEAELRVLLPMLSLHGDLAIDSAASILSRLIVSRAEVIAALQAAEREAVERGKDIETLTTGLTVMQARAEAVETALRRHGYRRSCDSPACNCGDQWTHGGHAARRLTEVAEVLGERTQGRTILAAVQTLLDEHGALTTALQTAETVLRRRKLHHRCP